MRHNTRTCDCPACEKMRACAHGDYRCYFCGAPSQVGHHVSNRSMGAKRHVPSNIAPLCTSCHSGIHTKGRKDWPLRMGRPELTEETLKKWEQGVLDVAREAGEWEVEL